VSIHKWHLSAPGGVAKVWNMLDIPALLRLANLAPQHLKLPTYF